MKSKAKLKMTKWRAYALLDSMEEIRTLGLPDMQNCRFAAVGRDGLLEFETIDDYVKIHIMACLGEPVMLVKREQSEKVYHLSMDQLRAFDLIDYL